MCWVLRNVTRSGEVAPLLRALAALQRGSTFGWVLSTHAAAPGLGDLMPLLVSLGTRRHVMPKQTRRTFLFSTKPYLIDLKIFISLSTSSFPLHRPTDTCVTMYLTNVITDAKPGSKLISCYTEHSDMLQMSGLALFPNSLQKN